VQSYGEKQTIQNFAAIFLRFLPRFMIFGLDDLALSKNNSSFAEKFGTII